MKKYLLLLSLFFFSRSNAQDSAHPAPITYKNYTSFPAFNLLALDSTRFSTLSVSNRKEPVVFIYFSPTCSHCQHQAEEITSHMNDFQHVQFLMVSAYSMQEIKQYADSYGLSHFKNITIGQDAAFAIGRFFDIKSLPGIFVYDKKGKYQTHFETNVVADSLKAAVKM